MEVIKAAHGRFDHRLLSAFESFVKKNLSETSDIDQYAKAIDDLLMRTEVLLKTMDKVEKTNEGLQLLSKVKHLLRGETEVRELEILLGEDVEQLQALSAEYCNSRQRIWNSRKQKMLNNKEMQKLLSIACDSYGKLLNRK